MGIKCNMWFRYIEIVGEEVSLAQLLLGQLQLCLFGQRCPASLAAVPATMARLRTTNHNRALLRCNHLVATVSPAQLLQWCPGRLTVSWKDGREGSTH